MKSSDTFARGNIVTTFLIGMLLLPVPLFSAETKSDEKTIFDMSVFEGQVLKPDVVAGTTSWSRPFFIVGGAWKQQQIAKKAKDAFGPASILTCSPTGYLATGRDVRNFRLTLFVGSSGLPVISFRSFVDAERYLLDLKEGVLKRIADGEEKVLAKASTPFFIGKTSPYLQLEITAKDRQLLIRRTLDGKRWETLIRCEDPKPLGAGVVMVGAEQPTRNIHVTFGDIVVTSLPEPARARPAPITDEDELIRMTLPLAYVSPIAEVKHMRHRMLRYLFNKPPPLPPLGRLMLAMTPNRSTIGRSGESRYVQFAALRVIHKHKLSLDVPELLLEGLDHKHQTIRQSAIQLINQLKIDPDRVIPKAVDLLRKPYPIDRHQAVELIRGRKDVKDMASRVCREVERRYKAAGNTKDRVILMRALATVNSPESVALLLRCVGDPEPEVRHTALRSLRFCASPLPAGSKWRRDVYTANPGLVKQVDAVVRAALRDDPSANCRAEAAGCLAAIGLAPELVIKALSDKDAKVRSTAAQGLCAFDRKHLQSAIPRLKSLKDDPHCGADAAATLDYILNPYKEPTPERSAKTPEGILEETRRNVRAAAKATLAKAAEESGHSLWLAQLILNRNRETFADQLSRNAMYNVRIGISGSLNFIEYPLFYGKNCIYPGRIPKQLEEEKKWTLFQYLDLYSANFEENLRDVRVMFGSENAQVTFRMGACFFFSAFLKDDPDYARRKLRNGMTVAESYEAWNDFTKKYIRHKALNGLWYELGANYMARYSIWPFIAMTFVAPDPETRQLARMLLDLTFIDDAQCSFGYVRGGSKSRIKTQGVYGSLATHSRYLYEGLPYGGIGLILATSGYEAPDVAVLLHRLEQFPKKPIEIINRRFGETRGPVPHCYIPDSRIYNYVYKTRNYMLGSALRPPMLGKSSIDIGIQQAQWNGLVFFDGTGLFTVSTGYTLGYYSFQHKNVWLLQRYDMGDLQIYMDPKFKRVEEEGWIFINHGDRAYAALKAVKQKGPYTWVDRKQSTVTDRPRGKLWAGMFAVLKQQDSPYVIQAGDVDEYGSFDGFKAAVRKNRIELGNESIKYSGPKQATIEMFFQKPVEGELITDKLPLVNGKPFNFERPMIYDSPFMKRKKGENIVTVRAANRTAVYDFDKATVTNTISALKQR